MLIGDAPSALAKATPNIAAMIASAAVNPGGFVRI
jgi:hypothetical protein